MTDSVTGAEDDQLYPADRGAAMVKADVGAGGGLTLDRNFWVEFPKGYRSHQMRLEGGDCSTDSFCYPSAQALHDLLSTTAGLWLAVVASGIYHGLNPGMGWPLVVSAALMERRSSAMWAALAALAAGHLVAMLAILPPFAMMSVLIGWQREIRIGAGAVVIALGLWLLVNRRHPRFLARVPPTRRAPWSCLAAPWPTGSVGGWDWSSCQKAGLTLVFCGPSA